MKPLVIAVFVAMMLVVEAKAAVVPNRQPEQAITNKYNYNFKNYNVLTRRPLSRPCLVNYNCYTGFFDLDNYCCTSVCCNVIEYTFRDK